MQIIENLCPHYNLSFLIFQFIIFHDSLWKAGEFHATTHQKLGSYTTPQQNKTGNLHLLILEEWGEVSHTSWGIEIPQLTPQLLPNSMHK